MNRHHQRGAGDEVVEPALAGATQELSDPVVLIDELAQILKTSPRTIYRQLRADTFFIPELPKVDHRHRWSRVVVLRTIAEAHTLLHERKGKAGLRVVPRKSAGETAREGAAR